LKSLPAAAIVGEADNPFSALPKELTDPLMTVEMSYIEAAFDEVDKRYGSFDAYVRDGLGITPETQEKLRAALLVGQPWEPSDNTRK
ncbi:MAG: tyrosine-protein phosphatase, partial [Sphingobium sp.]